MHTSNVIELPQPCEARFCGAVRHMLDGASRLLALPTLKNLLCIRGQTVDSSSVRALPVRRWRKRRAVCHGRTRHRQFVYRTSLPGDVNRENKRGFLHHTDCISMDACRIRILRRPRWQRFGIHRHAAGSAATRAGTGIVERMAGDPQNLSES